MILLMVKVVQLILFSNSSPRGETEAAKPPSLELCCNFTGLGEGTKEECLSAAPVHVYLVLDLVAAFACSHNMRALACTFIHLSRHKL